MRLGASLSGQLLTVASPLILVALGAYGTAGGGTSSPGFWILLLGLGLLAAAAWTLPWEATIDADGVHVRTLLRRQHLAWDDIVAIERHRRIRGGGPLVARTAAARRIAITDRVERPAEWDELKELVERHAPGVAVATPPPAHPFNR
jgi:hypothetical protein